MTAFAVAWEVLINNKPLSSSNEIPASSLEPTTTTTTTACPTSRCYAGCQMIGVIARCSTSCVKPPRSCSATSSGAVEVTTTATTPWTVVRHDTMPMTSMAPTATACIKVTLDNCIYQYETLSAGLPCPTIPVLPATCTASPYVPSIPDPPSFPTPTLTPPTLQVQQCHGADDFGSHSDIDGNVQSDWANDFCSYYSQSFTSGTAAVTWNSRSITYNNGISPYHWTVSWINGCATTVTEQSMSSPLGAGNPSVNCVSLLTDDWRNCK